MLWILMILFLLLPNNAVSLSHSFNKLQLPVGSEAYAFDSDNLGPYTGLNDGRIVKYNAAAFLDFATTSPNRSKELCDGKNGDDPKTGPLCGRPIALEFHHKTGDLYIVDAFRGLMVVGHGGGEARRLTGGRDGVPYDAPDAISIDPVTGDVYFTDVGTIFFKTTNMTEVLLSGDTSGRLLKYQPKTRRRTVVLTGLAVPNGLAVSKDGTFLLVAEYIALKNLFLWFESYSQPNLSAFLYSSGVHFT